MELRELHSYATRSPEASHAAYTNAVFQLLCSEQSVRIIPTRTEYIEEENLYRYQFGVSFGCGTGCRTKLLSHSHVTLITSIAVEIYDGGSPSVSMEGGMLETHSARADYEFAVRAKDVPLLQERIVREIASKALLAISLSS